MTAPERFVIRVEQGFVVLSRARLGGVNVTDDKGRAYACSRVQADRIAEKLRRTEHRGVEVLPL